ncbi:MAG: hypothetical protein JJU16_11865 [Alkalibacterium sp.]|nr:hypothetical protein [Alkalibacterium sp.]
MKKLTNLLALTMTVGMLMVACGGTNDGDDDPDTEQPAGGGMDDGVEDIDE